MKLALIGHGAMGQLIERHAADAGDQIGLTLTSADSGRTIEDLVAKLNSHDAAIDFSVGNAVLRNIEICARAGVPLVEGTTGWKDHEPEARSIVAEHDAALLFGANFSVGVNIFYRIVSEAGKLFAGTNDYAAFIEEEHHSRKRDAPSGTGIKLKELLAQHISGEIPIASVRAGHIPGTHKVGFDSMADQITLKHTARSRDGFAAGALLAAHWLVGRKGVFEFAEVIEDVMRGK